MGIIEQQPGWGALNDEYQRGNARLRQQQLDQQKSLLDNQTTSLSKFVQGFSGGTNPYQPATMPTGNRFDSGLSDAESRLRALLDNPDSINQSSAYKFRVGQGQEALQRSMGAKGLLNSGNRLMELTKYGQDMGSQEYDAQAGRLSGLLGTYGQGYVADKNANTNQFAAQSNAWNTSEGNRLRNMVGMAGVWSDINRPGSGTLSRQSGQMLPMQFNGGVY